MEQATINQRLKFLIGKLGLTAKAFSEAIEESPTTTHNYISERNAEPRARYLSKTLSHFAHIDARWLMTGDGDVFTSQVTEEQANHQPSKKNSGNIVGSITGGKNQFTTLADCAKDNENLRTQLEQLKSQLNDKERTIQILLKQQPK